MKFEIFVLIVNKIGVNEIVLNKIIELKKF